MSRRTRDPRDLSRRRFLARMAAAGGALVLPGCGSDGANSVGGAPAPGPDAAGALPNPEDSGIDYIVQVMMENRSYDHMLGWVPNSDGLQAQEFLHTDGSRVQTFHMGAGGDAAYGYQGCGWEDPAHGYDTGRVHYAGGAMNGFLQTVGDVADKFPVGYYNADDLLFYKGVAEHFTICDRYFHGILSSTFPNRIYIHAGTTDRNNNTLPYAQQAPSVLPTIWDQLKDKGISCANYFSDLPLTGLWGPTHMDISLPFEQFLVDAATGNLPSVSYFDPFFGFSAGESPYGVSRDDHPQADIRDGQVYLTEIYDALRADPERWARTLMIVTYDEWGGFYDHVPPPVRGVGTPEASFNDGRLGFRTPCVILGGRARRGHVSHLEFDPNSVINLIRWRFGLGPVGDSPRNETSLNMALALDFASAPSEEAPEFGQPSPGGLPANHRIIPYGSLCEGSIGGVLPPALPGPQAKSTRSAQQQRQWLDHQNELAPLYEMSKKYGLIR